MNFQIFKLDLERAEEPEIKLPTSIGLYQKKKIPPPPPKNVTYASLTTLKPLTMCVSQQTVQNSSRDGNATLPSSWETYMQVKKQQLESDMGQETVLKIGKRVSQGCILSPYLFNFYAYYIMRNAGLDVAQAGIKIDGRYA